MMGETARRLAALRRPAGTNCEQLARA